MQYAITFGRGTTPDKRCTKNKWTSTFTSSLLRETALLLLLWISSIRSLSHISRLSEALLIGSALNFRWKLELRKITFRYPITRSKRIHSWKSKWLKTMQLEPKRYYQEPSLSPMLCNVWHHVSDKLGMGNEAIKRYGRISVAVFSQSSNCSMTTFCKMTFFVEVRSFNEKLWWCACR